MAADLPEKIGPYEVASLIGKGATGTVYKATASKGGKVVALKVLRPEFVEDDEAVERFHREAEAVSRLSHPNLVRIIEKEQLDEVLYFVMEYVPGSSLEAVLRRRRLSLPEAFTVFKKVAKGLAAAHGQKIVHRDLSPRNILVSEDLATVKIVDFGISRVESLSATLGTLSTGEVSLGSLHYMAPEQATNMADTDHRADIYSLGVLLYEMLTGRVPVGRFSLPSALNSEVPSEIDPIVLRCLETNPGKRYASVAKLLSDVERLEDQLRLGLVSELKGLSRSTSKIFRKRQRPWMKWVVTAVFLLIAAGATAYLVLQGRGPTRQAVEPAGQTVEAAAVEGGRAVAEEDEAAAPDLEDVAPPPPPQDESEEAVAADRAVDTEPAPSRPQASASEPASQTDAEPEPEAAAESGAAEDLAVARAKLEADLLEPALRDIEAILEADVDQSVTAAAMLLKGEVLLEQGETAEVKAVYVELESRYRGSDAAGDAGLRLARLERDERGSDPRDVWERFNHVVAYHQGSQWAVQALLERAALEESEKWRTDDDELGQRVPMALVSYRQLVRAFPNDPATEGALAQLGEMYSDLKLNELAAESWEKLARGFPDNQHEAWWNLAQIYDRRLDDSERAVAAYEKVPQSSRHYGEAQRRLSRLRR